MNVQIEESWKTHLQPEFEKDYFRTLTEFVKSEYSQYQIFPPGKLIFNAFNLCPFDKVKVVIIGQDPYHGPGQAHGHRHRRSRYRKPDSLGRTRSIAAQRDSDRTRSSGRLSPKPRMGSLYRCSHSCAGRRKRTSCVYLVGSLCPTQRSLYRPQQASGTQLRPPFSPLCL